MIAESGVGVCQICGQKKNLEFPTARCRDCLENLCVSSSIEHADGKHVCEPLKEPQPPSTVETEGWLKQAVTLRNSPVDEIGERYEEIAITA